MAKGKVTSARAARAASRVLRSGSTGRPRSPRRGARSASVRPTRRGGNALPSGSFAILSLDDRRQDGTSPDFDEPED